MMMEIQKINSEEVSYDNSLIEMSVKSNKEKKMLYELIDLHHLVNALPYIDSFDNEFEHMAKRMVEEEMKLMSETNQVKNYLENFDIPTTIYLNNKNLIICNELKRFEEGKIFEKLNFDHYNINDDTALLSDMSTDEWKKMLKKYEIILENSHIALINIELMNKYKEVMWSEHMKMFSQIDINLQNDIKSLKEQIENVNKKRKLHQLSYANDLIALQNEKKEYKRKNNVVLNEIKKLLSKNTSMQYKTNVI